jgi:integrase
MAKRRANGEGTLRKRKDGRWESAIMVGWKDNGKPRIKYFYGDTKADVQRKVLTWKKTLPQGRPLHAYREYLVAEWADMWFDIHKNYISPTTQEGYRYTLRVLKEHFGRRKLDEIKAFDIELFLRLHREKGRADSTLAQYKGMLYQILHKAEANDLIHKNPARFVEKIRSTQPKQRKEAFTADEVKILMRELPYDRTGLSIRLLLGTGMRSQELLALQPSHIDEDGSSIKIEQAVVQVKGTAGIGPPKSRDSYRVIPIPPNLRSCAKMLRNTDLRYIWEEGKPDTPCNPSYFRDCFKHALEEIPSVRVLTPHCCRHTYVSQMQALGVDVSTIQSIVGHAEIDMTEYYLHVQESIRQTAVSKFSDAFPIEHREEL